MSLSNTVCNQVHCCLCGQQFEGVDPLEAHLALVHVLYLAYECDICSDALFPSDFALREHYTKIHNKKCFTVKYRVSPELDERRALLRRLVDQSSHKTDNAIIQQNKAPNSSESSNSYTSQLLKNCTSILQTQLMASSHFLNNCAKKEGDWGERNDGQGEGGDHFGRPIEGQPIEGVSFCDRKHKALLGQKRTFSDDDLNFDLNDRFSPVQMNSLNVSMCLEEMSGANSEIKVLPTKKQAKSRRKIKRNSGNDQSQVISLQESNEEAKQQKGGGPLVECSGCKRMVGQYRNSMLIHVSTHHCDQPIFECLADGCGKKWYSISARTKEHIETKHGGDFAFLQDNRSSLLPFLRSTAVRLFPGAY